MGLGSVTLIGQTVMVRGDALYVSMHVAGCNSCLIVWLMWMADGVWLLL
jgi:hypothetical protein